MRTMNRLMIILLAALLVAAGVWALADGPWADGAAARFITGNQAQMDAVRQAGAVARSGEFVADAFVATPGNLIKMTGIGGIVIGVSILLERRKKRLPAVHSSR